MVEDAIEIDSASDRDSGFGEQISNFTASIRSSILNYPVENGRRYHAFRSGVYCLPNDELEQDRLDLMHVVMTKAIGDNLFLAPMDPQNMHRVLDIGTGTGIWSMAMGDEHPHIQIMGNDLSAIQPLWVPPNVRFVIDDVESPWVQEAPFDFIFCRYMAACVKDWPLLVRRVYENLAPGGWAEFEDFDLQYYSRDDSLKEDSSTFFWANSILEAARRSGHEPSPGPHLEQWVHEAGFENVRHHRFSLPIGPWAKDRKLKEIGMYNLAQILDGLEAFSLRLFCNVLGWRSEDLFDLLHRVREELVSRKLHVQFDFHVVYGQKRSK